MRTVSLLSTMVLAACTQSGLGLEPVSEVRQAAERENSANAQIEAANAHLPEGVRAAKYCKMAVTPFSFYRGTAHLFWSDLEHDERLELFGTEGTKIWSQGDLHAANLGAFEDDQGRVVYDLNDFDEARIADHQLDLWRLATSWLLVADEVGGFDEDDREDLLDALTETYLDAVEDVRGNDGEHNNALTKSEAYGLLDEFLDDVQGEEGRSEMLEEWTLDGAFDLDHEDLGAIDPDRALAIAQAFPGYGESLSGKVDYDPEEFVLLDVAERLNAGTGSLGTPRFYALVEAHGELRILDIKQQTSEYVDGLGPAERVVIGRKALAESVDDYLGTMDLPDGAYTVWERSPYKKSFDLMDADSSPRAEKLAEQQAERLAMAHARADEDFDASFVPFDFEAELDDVADGNHDVYRAVVRDVALGYAEQVRADYEAFLTMVDCP